MKVIESLWCMALTADPLRGAEVQMPPAHGTFKQAQRVQQPAGEQLGFEVE